MMHESGESSPSSTNLNFTEKKKKARSVGKFVKEIKS